MLPAIIKGLHITSATRMSIVDKADNKSNKEHPNPFSSFFFFFKQNVSQSRGPQMIG